MATPAIRFNGHRHLKPGHRQPTPPLTVPVEADASGQIVSRGWAPGDVVRFDKRFAQQHNRLCACHDDGTCWAYQHAATWNVGHEKEPVPAFEVIFIAEQLIGYALGSPRPMDLDSTQPAPSDSGTNPPRRRGAAQE